MGRQCAGKEAHMRGLDRLDPLFMGGQRPPVLWYNSRLWEWGRYLGDQRWGRCIRGDRISAPAVIAFANGVR